MLYIYQSLKYKENALYVIKNYKNINIMLFNEIFWMNGLVYKKYLKYTKNNKLQNN